MTTYWLDRAHESNVNSNELAIAKLEVMVQEILQSGAEEDDILGHNSLGAREVGEEGDESVAGEGADRVMEIDADGNRKGKGWNLVPV
jgi:hypothetical protein